LDDDPPDSAAAMHNGAGDDGEMSFGDVVQMLKQAIMQLSEEDRSQLQGALCGFRRCRPDIPR
jgi:hypothetical protein